MFRYLGIHSPSSHPKREWSWFTIHSSVTCQPLLELFWTSLAKFFWSKSGNYTDSETLKEIIKESIFKQIADNKTKVYFTMTICLLGTVNKFYVLLTGIKQISLWSEESTWEFSARSVSRSELFLEGTVWIIKRRTLQETLWRMGYARTSEIFSRIRVMWSCRQIVFIARCFPVEDRRRLPRQ